MLRLALLAATAAPSAASAQSSPSASIAATDPGLFGQLGNYEPLYIRLAYRSGHPVILQAEGLAAGEAVPGMSNGVHHVSAGAGEVMLWIAYPVGASIDGLRISILDDKNRRISFVDTPAKLQWIAGAVRARSQRAEWAVRMNDEQQRLRVQPSAFFYDPQLWLGLTLMAGVPLYFILQSWLAYSWAGRWRIAALVPLIAVAPAVAFSLFALSRGSNLWPVTVIFLAPLGFIYLLAACALRAVARVRQQQTSAGPGS